MGVNFENIINVVAAKAENFAKSGVWLGRKVNIISDKLSSLHPLAKVGIVVLIVSIMIKRFKKNKVETILETNSSTLKDWENLMTEKNTISEENTVLQKKITELSARNEGLLIEKSALETTISEKNTVLQKKITELSARNEGLLIEKSDLETTFSETNTVLQEKVTELSAKNEALNKEMIVLKTKISSLTGQIDSLNDTNGKHISEIEKLKILLSNSSSFNMFG